ncbi:pilus assembly protein TadG-related protein [Streptomyces sp. NPDC048481]|uniref:pilus assembly protein TadG-related protein n=1 Tax=Streptomyces sp. NPDC048481 TaxID=3365557 RepID=UPI003711EA40
MNRSRGDAGQAFPIYITVVAGLLFLAFAYLAVGQAAANRNGAQTAADAAALAAAQDTRDQLAGRWTDMVRDPATWGDILRGIAQGLHSSCPRAYELAAQNEAGVTACEENGLDFRIEVRTDKSVGDSIIPGTEDVHSKAEALAVIDPLCDVEPPGEGAADDALPELSCKGDRHWTPDPDDPASLPEPQDLFRVHLAD